jgi:hypothetical protein
MSIDRELLPAAQADLTQPQNQFFYRLDEFQYEALIALMEQDALWHRQFQSTASQLHRHSMEISHTRGAS